MIETKVREKDLDRTDLRSFIEENTFDGVGSARMKGYIHADDCEKEPHRRKFVDAEAPMNWPGFGANAYGRYVAKPVFSVIDVKPGDMLNVRSETSTRGRPIGGIPPNTTGLTVLHRQGSWCRVHYGKVEGWVNCDYLSIDYNETFR